MSASFSAAYYPNTKAVARITATESGNPAFEQTLIDYATQCIKPARDYFEEKFEMENLVQWCVLSRQHVCFHHLKFMK